MDYADSVRSHSLCQRRVPGTTPGDIIQGISRLSSVLWIGGCCQFRDPSIGSTP